MLGGKSLGYLQMQLLAQSFKSLKTKFGAKLALNFFFWRNLGQIMSDTFVFSFSKLFVFDVS